MIRNGPWKKTLSLLLCASALAWGLIPQGGAHSHAGGLDPTHLHEARNTASHHDSHSHDSEDGHHEHADVSLSCDSTAHLHWRLLGLKFSMPTSDDPTDDGEDRHVVPPTIVRTVQSFASGAWGGPTFDRALTLSVGPASLDTVDQRKMAQRSATAATSISLCDVARRDLCGVLLA